MQPEIKDLWPPKGEACLSVKWCKMQGSRGVAVACSKKYIGVPNKHQLRRDMHRRSELL